MEKNWTDFQKEYKKLYDQYISLNQKLSDANKEIEKLHLVINDIDSSLSNMEDYLHGENGKQITYLRKQIAKLTKTQWSDFKLTQDKKNI